MSRKYGAVSGVNTVLLDATVDATGGTGVPGDPTALLPGRNLLGEALPSGRVLWLRSIFAHDASAAIALQLFDATAGSDATATTRRLLLQCASGQLSVLDIPEPGLKFSTGCVVCKDTTGASGSFPIGSVGGSGYYE